jgi:hypothetical protein
MREITVSSQAVIGEMAGRFSSFALSARNSEKVAWRAHDLSFGSLAKVDHMVYKQRAYMTLNTGNAAEYTQAIAVNHHQCRLGKWYEGDGGKQFRGAQSYRALEQPHARVHSNALALIKILEGGWEHDLAKQQEIYRNLEEMEAASGEVMHLLENMVQEKHGL